MTKAMQRYNSSDTFSYLVEEFELLKSHLETAYQAYQTGRTLKQEADIGGLPFEAYTNAILHKAIGMRITDHFKIFLQERNIEVDWEKVFLAISCLKEGKNDEIIENTIEELGITLERLLQSYN